MRVCVSQWAATLHYAVLYNEVKVPPRNDRRWSDYWYCRLSPLSLTNNTTREVTELGEESGGSGAVLN